MSEERRKIVGGDLNAATSRTGYSTSTKSHFEKVDNQFQEFIQRTGWSLIQSKAHTHKDLIGGVSPDDIKSATLDQIIRVLKDLWWWVLDLQWYIRHHSSVEKSAGLNKFGLSAGPRLKPRQLKSVWIWANRPSSKGSKLLFPVIKANKIKIMELIQWWRGRNAGAEEYSALGRSVWEWSRVDIVHNRWANVELSRPWRAKPRRSNRRDQGENFDPEQIPRIQSKLDAIMRPIVQQLITDINDGKCIKEMSLRCVVESRVVVTAGSLMHKNPLSLDLTLRSHERSFPVRYSARQTRQTPFS